MTYDPARHHRRSIRVKGYDYAQPGAYFVTICAQDRECRFGTVADGVMHLNDAGRMVASVWDELPIFYPGVGIDAFVVMPNHIHGIIILHADPSHLVGAGPRACPAGPRACPPGPRACPGRDGRNRDDNRDGDPIRGPRDGSRTADATGQAGGARSRPGPGQARGPAPTAVPGMGSDEGAAQAGNSGPRTLSLGDVVHRFKTMTTKRYADGVKLAGWPPFPGRLWQRNYYEHIIRNDVALNRIRDYIEANPALWETDPENPSVFGTDVRG